MSERKEYRLEQVAQIVDCEHKTAPSVDVSDFISVRTTDISNGRIHFDSANRVSEPVYLEWTKRLTPRKGDIILAREAPVGEVGYVPDCRKVCLGQRTVLIRTNPVYVDNFYLLYYLTNPDIKQDLISRSTGSVVEHLNVKDIKNLLLRIAHSLPEQRAIAGVLSSLDDKIDLLHRQNKTLEGIASALWRKMFIEDADPGWKKGKLEDVAEINPLRSIKKGTSTSYLDMSNMPTHGPFPREWVQRPFLSGMKFRNGDTIIARITPCLENGKTAFINFLNDNEIAWGSTEYIVLAPRTGYCPEWFYFLARSDDFRDFAIQNMTGTSGRQRVSGDSIAHYEIAIPPMTVVEGFRTFSEPIMNHIKQNSLQARTLSLLRDTLLSKLMSGEVRVRL